ncbi:MAG: hypothetical protein HZB25_06650 [Candidatus Eisenbacteria bacterium]|nr:hypothetical protein [Candidatus Eisenbacteria bacterium]
MPFLAYALVMVLVDPYNFFGLSNLVPRVAKQRTAEQYHPVLWKMIEFRRDPQANILLGDSRMNGINPEVIRKVSGARYYNFAFDACSLAEIVRTFWFADSLVKLQNVYIGLNFDMYNRYSELDRTVDFHAMVGNPFRYFVDPTVFRGLRESVMSAWTGKDPKSRWPKMSREEFWRRQLAIVAAKNYKNFAHPDAFEKDLARIAEHCRRKGIRLVFVSFPSHVDLQRRVGDFKLEGQRAAYLRELPTLAPVYDFDFPNVLSRDSTNYSDPYHFKPKAMEVLVGEVWGGRAPAYGKVLETR